MGDAERLRVVDCDKFLDIYFLLLRHMVHTRFFVEFSTEPIKHFRFPKTFSFILEHPRVLLEN